MATTIGALVYHIKANTSSFTKGMTASRKELAAGKKLFNASRNPVEQYADKIRMLSSHLKKGIIDQQTHNRALAQATAKLPAASRAMAKLMQMTGMSNAAIAKWSIRLRGAALAATAFGRGVRATFAPLTGMVARMVALAGATLGVFVAVRKVIGAFADIDETVKLARSLDIATESLIGLRRAADLADTAGAAALDKGLGILTRRVGEAAAGMGEGVQAFRTLGLSASRLANQGIDKTFIDIAQAIQKLPTAAQRADVANKLLGRGGKDLMNTLALTRAEFVAISEEAGRLGEKFSALQGEKIEVLNDAVRDMKAAFGGFFKQLALAGGPALTDMVRGITQLLIGMSKMLSNTLKNKESMEKFAKTIKFIAIAIPTVTVAFIALTAAIKLAALAQTIYLALSGPAGWAILAGAVVAAGVTIGGIAVVYNKVSKAIDAAAKKAKAAVIVPPGAKGDIEDVEGAVDSLSAKMEALASKGTALESSLRTPMEKYADQIKSINELIEHGKIDWETHRRAAAKAVKELEAATKARKDFSKASKLIGASGSAGGGTAASFNAVMNMINDRKNEEKELKDISRKADRRDRLLESIEREAREPKVVVRKMSI